MTPAEIISWLGVALGLVGTISGSVATWIAVKSFIRRLLEKGLPSG